MPYLYNNEERVGKGKTIGRVIPWSLRELSPPILLRLVCPPK
jgi:hypothetical protein